MLALSRKPGETIVLELVAFAKQTEAVPACRSLAVPSRQAGPEGAPRTLPGRVGITGFYVQGAGTRNPTAGMIG